jgi:hypothetical protein
VAPCYPWTNGSASYVPLASLLHGLLIFPSLLRLDCFQSLHSNRSMHVAGLAVLLLSNKLFNSLHTALGLASSVSRFTLLSYHCGTRSIIAFFVVRVWFSGHLAFAQHGMEDGTRCGIWQNFRLIKDLHLSFHECPLCSGYPSFVQLRVVSLVGL